MDVVDELVHGLGRDAERERDFLGLGRPAETVGQLFLGGLQAAGTRSHRSTGPVAPAQLVEQGTADAGGGEPVERDAALGIEAPGRLRETEHSGRHEVAAAHVVGDAMCDLRHHVLHERQVLPDQLVLVLCLLGIDLVRALHSVPPAPAGRYVCCECCEKGFDPGGVGA